MPNEYERGYAKAKELIKLKGYKVAKGRLYNCHGEFLRGYKQALAEHVD